MTAIEILPPIGGWSIVVPACLAGVDRHAKEQRIALLSPPGTVLVVPTRSGALGRLAFAGLNRVREWLRYRDDRQGD